MLKYHTKNDVIKEAANLGSLAKTFKGAAKFLKSAYRPSPSVFCIPKPWGGEHRLQSHKESVFEKRASRICADLGYESRDERERRMNSLADDAASARGLRRLDDIEEILADKFNNNWPFRRSESGWAGGDHMVSVGISDTCGAGGSSEKVWSRNGKWSGTNSYCSLRATYRALKYFPSLQSNDGSIIMDAEKVGHREFKIKWVGQARGFDLKLIDGFLIRGYHIKGTNLKTARRKVVEARKIGAENLANARIKARSRRYEINKLMGVWVGIHDSLNAGNCSSETETFRAKLEKRFNRKVYSIRADKLLKIRDDIFTRRAVAIAVANCS